MIAQGKPLLGLSAGLLLRLWRVHLALHAQESCAQTHQLLAGQAHRPCARGRKAATYRDSQGCHSYRSDAGQHNRYLCPASLVTGRPSSVLAKSSGSSADVVARFQIYLPDGRAGPRCEYMRAFSLSCRRPNCFIVLHTHAERAFRSPTLCSGVGPSSRTKPSSPSSTRSWSSSPSQSSTYFIRVPFSQPSLPVDLRLGSAPKKFPRPVDLAGSTDREQRAVILAEVCVAEAFVLFRALIRLGTCLLWSSLISERDGSPWHLARTAAEQRPFCEICTRQRR